MRVRRDEDEMMGLSTFKSECGFSLLEVMVASVLIGLVMAVGVHCMLRGIGVNSRALTQGSVQELARSTVEALLRELKDSGESCTGWAVGLNPAPASQYYDQDVTQLSFSRCIGYDAALDTLQWGSVVTFSYQPAQGDEPGKVIRTENGVQTIVCDRVSDFRACYFAVDGQLQLTLTVTDEDPQSPGHLIVASHTASVTLRN